MSDHVAFFAFPQPTPEVIQLHARCSPSTKEQALESGEWQMAFWERCFWSTNASHLSDGGHEVEAPYTGCFHMVVYDNQYGAKAFRDLVSSLECEIRRHWTNRSVEVFVSDGNIQ
jgi:hypothetical protein